MKTTTLYWILGTLVIAGVIIYIVNNNNQTKQNVPNCGCTRDNQCGRDQYCDGCNCQLIDVNRVRPIFIPQPFIMPHPKPGATS